MNCKCEICKTMVYTEAPSRIKYPLCAACALKERNKSVPRMPKDLAKVRNQLRKEFGVCPGPNCNNPLIPLQSFKANGKMYCGGCYSKIEELIVESEKSNKWIDKM